LKRSNRLILLIGVFLAIVTFVGIVLLLGGNRGTGGPDKPPTELPTVYAKTNIPLGTAVTADMLETKTIAVTGRDATAFQNSDLLLGKIVRTNVVAGKQLTQADFAVTGAPVAIDCPTGQLCIAVDVDQVTGVGTLIRTGDYVDMLVSFQMNVVTVDPDTGAVLSGAPEINSPTSKLLLQGMQVVGTLLPPPPAAAEGGQGQAAGDPGTPLGDQHELVVLSVTAQQAEVIKFAQTAGPVGPTAAISLALRSPGDFRDPTTQEPIIPAPAGTTGITLSKLVNEYGVLVPEILEAQLPGASEAPTR
jgi:Flp pilus assembly protein CpaB